MMQSAPQLMLIEIITADPHDLINRLYKLHCTIHGIEIIDELTLHINTTKREFRVMEKMFRDRQINYRVISISGWESAFHSSIKRPVMMLGILVIVLFTVILPKFVLFIDVEGNETVSRWEILEVAERNGISIGTKRKEIHSESVKNALLEEVPSLEWAGINSNGCVAIISVTEKVNDHVPTKTEQPVASIVAARDGRIVNCTVLDGTQLCAIGQSVVAGQTLVSGYTDCGIYLQATTAKAEVLAQTEHKISVISPLNAVKRLRQHNAKRFYTLKLGKKLINLRKGSGIQDTTCVKIQKENHFVLPGGFYLPISLIQQEYIYYSNQDHVATDYDWLVKAAEQYIENQMVAGQIIDREAEVSVSNGLARLCGNYSCTEMIGKTKYEEITYEYGNVGENS